MSLFLVKSNISMRYTSVIDTSSIIDGYIYARHLTNSNSLSGINKAIYELYSEIDDKQMVYCTIASNDKYCLKANGYTVYYTHDNHTFFIMDSSHINNKKLLRKYRNNLINNLVNENNSN